MRGIARSLPAIVFLAGLIVAGAAAAGPASDRPAAPQAGAMPTTIAVAVSARVTETAGVTRLVVDLSAPVSVETAFTANPDRLVVDLPAVNFQVDPAAGRLDGRGVGLVRAFRFGTVASGRSKIVVDLSGAAALRKVEVASIAGDAPSRLTIELVRIDPAAFRAAAVGVQADPQDASAFAAAPSPGDGRPVVVIDPGHGGIDPGAGGTTGTLEKDVVLAFADALADKLGASGRYRVVLTRHDDSFVSLGDRVRIARDAGAALMISVHADMLSDASVSGATVYTASDQASDADAGRFAAAENRADEAAGVTAVASPDVSGILFDLARRETRTYAHQFQRNLTGYWAKIARLNRNPERSAGFRVLQAADVPSVLLELGYLSSEKDRASLTSATWRDRAAGSVAAAVDTFFAARAAAPQTAAEGGRTVVQ